MSLRPAVFQLLTRLRFHAHQPSQPAPGPTQWALELLPLLRYEGAEEWFRRRCLKETGSLFDELRNEAKLAKAVSLRREEETVRVVTVLERGGFEYVLIKGAARTALGREVPFLDARPSTDIDILMAPHQAEPAFQALIRHGYQIAKTARPNHHHLDNLVGEMGIGVELHRTTAATVAPATAWQRLGQPGQTVEWQGHTVRVPPLAELAWHQVQHALVEGPYGFRLRHFVPVVAIAAIGVDGWAEWKARLDLGESIDDQTGMVVPAATGRRWLHAARWLAGDDGASIAALARVLAWRLRSFDG